MCVSARVFPAFLLIDCVEYARHNSLVCTAQLRDLAGMIFNFMRIVGTDSA